MYLIDNSFKLFKKPKKVSKKKEKEIIVNTYSYICEDFVSSLFYNFNK